MVRRFTRLLVSNPSHLFQGFPTSTSPLLSIFSASPNSVIGLVSWMENLTSLTTRLSVLPINRYSLGIQEAPCFLRL